MEAYPDGPKKRSLEAVELGEGVGAPTFQRLARVLPGWTVDTFRQVLDGGPIPALPVTSSAPPNVPTASLDVRWPVRVRVTGEIIESLQSRPGATRVLWEMVNWHRQFQDAKLSGDDLFNAIEEALARAKLLQLDSNQQPFG